MIHAKFGSPAARNVPIVDLLTDLGTPAIGSGTSTTKCRAPLFQSLAYRPAGTGCLPVPTFAYRDQKYRRSCLRPDIDCVQHSPGCGTPNAPSVWRMLAACRDNIARYNARHLQTRFRQLGHACIALRDRLGAYRRTPVPHGQKTLAARARWSNGERYVVRRCLVQPCLILIQPMRISSQMLQPQVPQISRMSTPIS
jgi:hypothetical protein